MTSYSRPRVVVSACLEFEPVRYNGQVMPAQIVRDLQPYVDYVKVCPEYEIGLGVPRDPIRIVREQGKEWLLQPRTGEDVTEAMDAFTDKFITSLPPVDGFIFKSGSPTIGLHNIKVYAGIDKPNIVDKTSGFFARKFVERYHGYPMEEDDRLRNNRIRHHFLTKLFTFAAFRQATENGTDLDTFHVHNHLLFTTYNPAATTQLDELLASMSVSESDYLEGMKHVLAKPPVTESYVTTANQILDAMNPELTQAEQAFLNEQVAAYAANLLSEHGILTLLRAFLIRFTHPLAEQSLFAPYPRELLPPAEQYRDHDYWKDEVFTYG
ncbi:MAG: YbgA family protein [Thermoplasmatota archaeon]